MTVNAAGKMSGSLGGGIMEHKFVELAKSRLQQHVAETSVHQQVHDKEAAKNQSGMICSGEQTIFLYTVKKAEAPLIKNIIASLEQNFNGTLQLSPTGISFSTALPAQNFELYLKPGDDFLFTEKTGPKNNLFIIGGGHCSLALSELMARMDFYVHVVDDRAGLNTMELNIFAHRKTIVNDYSELAAVIPSATNNYVVIMTMGYRTDSIAVQALEGKQFAYIGLLGSKTKIRKIFEQFKANGIPEKWLRTVHAPIGISIKSQTPEEIAVSIAAEIIRIKNEKDLN